MARSTEDLVPGWSRRIAEVVVRRPVVVIVAVLVATTVLGGLYSQAVVADAGAVDNDTFRTFEQLDAEFGRQPSVLQLVVTTDQDVRNTDTLAAVADIRAAIESSDAQDTLAQTDGHPAVLSFLDGVEAAAASMGMAPADLDDAAIRDLQQQALGLLPAAERRLLEGLLSTDDPPRSGMVLVFQDAEGLADADIADRQRAIIEAVDGVGLPAGVAVEPFSMELLLTDQDAAAEVGRLFSIALVVILVLLAVMYWVRPEAGQWWRIGRRTGADVLLTLCVILLAIAWMQGIGVLLGPGYLGLIGPFSPETDLVLILLVGLGVDFAIHLFARYRDELGSSTNPDAAHRRATTTVGVALAVATAATMIGFLTNLASPVTFMRTLGVLAAVGVAAAVLLTLTFLPAVRLLLDRRAQRLERLPASSLGSQPARTVPRLAARSAWLARRAPVATLAAALLATIAGGYGYTQMDTRFELRDFVPRDQPMLATYDQITDDFGGGFAEVTQVRLAGDLTAPDADDALAAALDAAQTIPAVERVQDVEIRSDHDGADVARVSLMTNAGLAGAPALVDDLHDAFGPLNDQGIEVTPASMEIAQAELTQAIEDTQVISLAAALAAAMLLLTFYYWRVERRPLLGIVALVPASIVVAWTFGMMALTGIPLNPVTATLAALSIGIAVPFTIHVTSRFLEERRTQPDAPTALRQTAQHTGAALAGSALTSAIGFSILTTSTLLPFEQLGYVIIYVTVFSLAAALLVLPSLLALWDQRDRRAHGAPHPDHHEQPHQHDPARHELPSGPLRVRATGRFRPLALRRSSRNAGL